MPPLLSMTLTPVRQVLRSLHGCLPDATAVYTDLIMAVSGEAGSVLLTPTCRTGTGGPVTPHSAEEEKSRR